jgi:hypothetical protein
MWIGPQGHSAAAIIGADPASAPTRGSLITPAAPRARHPARGRALRAGALSVTTGTGAHCLSAS